MHFSIYYISKQRQSIRSTKCYKIISIRFIVVPWNANGFASIDSANIFECLIQEYRQFSGFYMGNHRYPQANASMNVKFLLSLSHRVAIERKCLRRARSFLLSFLSLNSSLGIDCK